jgi:hypothetical protein
LFFSNTHSSTGIKIGIEKSRLLSRSSRQACLSDIPKGKLKVSDCQIKITVKQELPFSKGCHVERMGRHGWRGVITAIEGDMAYVNWGYNRTWIAISELYPLDSKGNPYIIPKHSNVIEISRRAREKLKLLVAETPPEDIQGKLFD